MFWTMFLGLAQANIVNGSLEPEFPATVALGAQFGNNAFSACTGTLITPKIILSAAHCGGDLPPELIVQAGKAFFGDSVLTADSVIGFSDVIVHPDYVELEGTIGGTLGEYDISLLVLQEEAPVQPIFYWPESMDETWVGQEIISVGFGITDANANDSGTKRSAPLVVSDIDDMFVISDNADNPNQANICSGDSGGSQMFFSEDWGQWVQIAVHSWGDQYCTQTSGSTRTDVVNDWILETVQQVHGTTDMCEINGFYDDDECTTYSICQNVDPACEVVEEDSKMACSTSSTMDWMGLIWLPVLLGRRRL